MIKNHYLLLIIILIFSGRLQAQYAVGGTSENYNKVYWLTWNPALSDANPLKNAPSGFSDSNIVSGNYTWMYSPDIRIVATVRNLSSGELEPYTPGEWTGDRLGNLYSGAINGGDLDAPKGVPFSGMATPNGVTATFDIGITVEFRINGNWTQIQYPGIVIADAEEMDGSSSEYISATTNGQTAWQLLDRYIHAGGNPDNYILTLSNSGKDFLIRAVARDAKTPSVMYAHGAESLSNVKMRGSGKSALAIGFIFPFDLGDAPASYGDNVRHFIDSFEMTEAFSNDGNYPIDELPMTQLIPKATVYIGEDNVDADGLGTIQQGSDPEGASNDQLTGAPDEETIDVSLYPIKVNQDGILSVSFPVTNTKNKSANVYMWMDFNSNDRFDGEELEIVPIPPVVYNYPVEVTYPSTMFAGKIKAGSLYSRIRITTTSLQDDPVTIQIDERATILAADGETEDYRFNVEGVTIAGNLKNDANGLTDNIISGPGIGILDEAQLFVYLVNEMDEIQQKYQVGNDGSYWFGNVNPGNYLVKISTLNLELGTSLSFSPELPAKWRSVGQSFGENNAAWIPGTPQFFNDPNMDQEVVIPMDGTDISGVDFAVEVAPTAMDISVPSSPAGQKVILTETLLKNFISDREDAYIDLSSLKLFDEMAGIAADNLAVPGEGTYTIVRGATTNLEFLPSINFSGETTPIKYMIRDSAGVESNLGEIMITIEEPSLIITNPMIYQRVN